MKSGDETKQEVTFVDCMLSAAKYQYKSEWREKEPALYKSAQYYGYLKSCTEHMITVPAGHKKEYSFKKCQEEYRKARTAITWALQSPETFFFAKREGWLLELGVTDRQNKLIPSYDEVLNSALHFNSTKDWRLNDSNNYKYAIKFGWRNAIATLIKARMYEQKQIAKEMAQKIPEKKYKLNMEGGKWKRVLIT